MYLYFQKSSYRGRGYFVSWEPEGRYCSSKMFRWEPEGRYCCTKSMAIAPFWFSTEHRWFAITPFWLSTDDFSPLPIPHMVTWAPSFFLNQSNYFTFCLLSKIYKTLLCRLTVSLHVLQKSRIFLNVNGLFCEFSLCVWGVKITF